MTTPKQQHYLPQLILNNFVDTEGYLYHYCKNRRYEIQRSNPRKLFKQNHIYTYEDDEGNKDHGLDQAYQDIEAEIGPVIKKIIQNVQNGYCASLTQNERATLNVFLYNQWKRVPDTIGNAFSLTNEEWVFFTGRGLHDL